MTTVYLLLQLKENTFTFRHCFCTLLITVHFFARTGFSLFNYFEKIPQFYFAALASHAPGHLLLPDGVHYVPDFVLQYGMFYSNEELLSLAQKSRPGS